MTKTTQQGPKTGADLEQLYRKGEVVEVCVKRIRPYGAFVTLDGGVQGVIRTREMSWEADGKHPHELLRRGQTVKAMVLGVQRTLPRLELSLRQAERDPWHQIEQRYRLGKVVRCTVTGLIQKGAFIELEPAVSGFVPLHEVSDPAPEQIEKVLWRGDTVEAVITRLDHEERRVELSIRQRLRALEARRERAFRQKFMSQPAQGVGTSLGERLSNEGRMALLSFFQHHGEPEAEAPEAEAEPSPAVGLRRILVADDDAGFRAALQDLLERLGHEVTAVERAERAVALCAEEEFDLLLIDLGFAAGAMDGLGAVRAIRAGGARLPVIVVTGLGLSNSYEEIAAQARAAGASAVMLKPVDLNGLRDLMGVVADGRDLWADEQPAWAAAGYGPGAPPAAGAGGGHERVHAAVRRELAHLLRETDASAAVVFHMPHATLEVLAFCRVGAQLTGYEASKYTLQASPVFDVIRHSQELFETDIANSPQRFRHLGLLDFASCLGVPVRALGRPEYGLLLFHPRPGHFTEGHLRQARASAKLIGAVIAREEAELLIQRVQPFVVAGQVSSTLIHELSNRLASTNLLTRALRVEFDKVGKDPSAALDDGLRQRAEGSLRELEKNNQTVKQLLGLYVGMMQHERRQLVNINESLRRACDALAPVAERDGVDLVLRLEDGLPLTLSVGVWLEQVFVNIALNAVQHVRLARGGGEVVVETRFLRRGGALPLQVRFTDTGPGIHGQHLDHIFDLGFSTRPDGTGLGLFTSRRLVESLRGRIGVEQSVMLIGTTFLIELPLVVPSVETVAS